ncbi:MAG: type II toxin-antitoxin system RelE/ParE family toxin [Chroococcidiopsidaceae cyanobacterium CP_BM_ER_R8_30]|nr:type II toxin-antitoxin system RelE/ParE family toxin [Chroococcidiopsidaceae cyanobacterium CP_BM_ER_R8_30]
MAYRVEITRKAAKQVKSLPQEERERIGTEIEALTDNPRPIGVRKISGERDFYRVRVGDYRIIYEIQDKILLILVIGVGHRREIYRGI